MTSQRNILFRSEEIIDTYRFNDAAILFHFSIVADGNRAGKKALEIIGDRCSRMIKNYR